MRYGNPKSWRQLSDLWRGCFDHLKACRRLEEVRRVRFTHRKACRRLSEVRKKGSDHRKSCRRLTELSRVGIYHCKACWMLAEVRSDGFDLPQPCGDFRFFVECISTTKKHVKGLQKFGEFVLTNAERVRGLQFCRVRFVDCIACRKLAEVRRVRFD